MKKPVQIFNYSIKNSADGKSADVYIDGEIVDASTQAMLKAWFGDSTTTSYKSFRNELDKLDASVYNIYLNGPGGHVGDALAIHDLLTDLQNKGKTINTIGRGIVASSLTLILLASKNPEMSANSWFMMHTVSGGAFGTVDQVENYARSMRQFNDKIRDLYASKSGMRKEEVTKLMNAETWLNAQEAKEKGFVSVVSGDAEFTNKISEDSWDYANTAVLNSYNNSVKPKENDSDMKKILLDLKNEIVAGFKALKPVTDAKGNFDQTAFANQIAEAISKPFENLGERLETEVQTLVDTAVTAAVKPVDNKDKKPTDDKEKKPAENKAAEKSVEDRLKELEQKNKELETEITNMVGAESKPGSEKGTAIIGSFN